MLNNIVKPLIFIAITQALNLAIANKVWSATTPKEVYLKQMTERLEDTLRDSVEAQTFLREDIQDAITVLKKASFQWTSATTSMPLLFGNEGQYKIQLSQDFSFLGSPEQRIATILGILFNLQRQIAGSTLPIPELRITLFSKKFSPILLGGRQSCRLSLYPLPQPLSTTQRKELVPQLLSLVQSKGYEYGSDWAQKVIWVELESRTDDGCRGDNRNITQLKANMIDLASLKSRTLAKVEQTSCGYDEVDMNKAYAKLLKGIKHNFTECSDAFWN